MNFTREPIIETVISPKDGYKLCIRSSKLSQQEEFFVDAVEVVSFGQAFFFRGQERPKPFLVPVTDYEIFEVKDTRVVLKNIAHERNIKIGGGRDAPVRAAKEAPVEKVEEERQEAHAEASSETTQEPKGDRKRDRRRHRRRRGNEEKREWTDREHNASETEAGSVSSEEDPSSEKTIGEEPKITSALFSHLLPPPPTLISEKLSRYKELSEEKPVQPAQEEGETLFFREESEEKLVLPFPAPSMDMEGEDKHFFS